MSKQYSVYIMTNASRTFYIGVTNNLARRVSGHKQKLVPGFTSKYNITQLVWYEHFGSPSDAISREKQLKGWRREKKTALIHSMNPGWKDLALEEPERPFDSAQGDQKGTVVPFAPTVAKTYESDESRNLSPPSHVERSRDISRTRPFDSAQGDGAKE